jgi:hypothetical protein
VLALLKKRLEEVVERSEILQWEVSSPVKSLQQRPKTPKSPNVVNFEAPNYVNAQEPPGKTFWDYYGIFNDDPTWWPMLNEIERRRNRQRLSRNKRMKK